LRGILGQILESGGSPLSIQPARTAKGRNMPLLFTLDELESTIGTVRAFVPPTPAYAWPLLAKASGAEVIVKHENHTPTGSFKARGVLVYVDALRRAGRLP
jgi:threonine dehydratase